MHNQIRREIVERWTKEVPEGISVADISNKYIRENVAQLLQNQQNDLYSNTLNEDFGIGVGAPTGADQGIPHGGDAKAVFAPVSLALVRRVFPQLFANVLVGVQAMQGPVGLAYAMRHVYKDELDKGRVVEAAWKDVPEYSGFTGSQANTHGPADSGLGVETQAAEAWSVNDHDKQGKIPELAIMFSRQAIVAKTRKIASSFSLESIDDIKKMQGVDMVNDMVNVLQYELTAEIDRETIARCKSLCKLKTLKPGDTPAADGWSGRWSQERLSNIITHIIAQSNDIAIATRKNPGNIAVVSPAVATALQSATQFFNKITTDVTGSTATPEVGTLNGGSIKVYRDAYAVNHGVDNEEVLIAYKGASNDDAGVIFCPYVTGVVNQAIDPNTFSPRIGIMTRYAFANNMLGADNYYRLLKFQGIASKVNGDTY